MTDSTDRINKLEEKVCYLEDLADTLNQALFRQQAMIDLLQAQLREMHRRMQETRPVETRLSADELPPHY